MNNKFEKKLRRSFLKKIKTYQFPLNDYELSIEKLDCFLGSFSSIEEFEKRTIRKLRRFENGRLFLKSIKYRKGTTNLREEIKSSTSRFLKYVEPPREGSILDISKDHNKILFFLNIFLFAKENIQGSYREFDDFNHGYFIGGDDFKKFSRLINQGIKKNHLNECLKRIFGLVRYLFNPVDCDSMVWKLDFSLKPSFKEEGSFPDPVDMFICTKMYRLMAFYDCPIISKLYKSDERVIFEAISNLITAINDQKVIRVFYDLVPEAFSSLTIIILIRTSCGLGDLKYAQILWNRLKKIEKFHPELNKLRREIDSAKKISILSKKLGIDINSIDTLSGVEFEVLIADKFASLDFITYNTPKTGDFGADIILETKSGSKIVIQCKRYNTKVNLKAVQEVLGAINHYGADFGVVITNNSFLNSAKKLAKNSDVELWGREELIDLFSGDISFSEISNI